MPKPLKKRVTVYIDGFNFYYGLKRSLQADSKWGNAYWIDMVRLCEGFLAQDEELEKVIYFTASPLSSGKQNRQGAFLNANKIIGGNRFEVVRGKYLEKHIMCPYCKGDISRPEEKKTDVNISVRMINDCIHGLTDTVVLVSADSDLIPPLALIRKEFPSIKLKVWFPPSNYSNDIADTLLAWKLKPTLMKKSYKRFENAVMSDTVGENPPCTIPAEWKARQTLRGTDREVVTRRFEKR